MTTRKHQIVERIPAEGESPVVLFDFDLWFKLGVGTDFSPPEVRDSSTWTQLEDGNTSGASTLGDRVIRLVLTQFRGNAEDQAEVLQTLGRLLDDSRGQWFLWQDEGTVHERFFRTKRASVPVEDHYLLERPLRTLNLTIPAEPKARGRRVEGQVVITNSPVSGANPIMAQLPEIKGDLSVPLWIEAVYTSVIVGYTAIASLSMPPQVPFVGPVWLDSADMTPEAGTGYAWSVVSDAAYVGGSARRLTQSVPDLAEQTVLSSVDVLDGVLPGDYHVLLRAGIKSTATPDFATKMLLGNGSGVAFDIEGPTLQHGPFGEPAHFGNWFDMGIVRLPTAAPRVTPDFDDDMPASQIDWALILSGGADTAVITIDGFLFIPAELDQSRDSAFATLYAGSGGMSGDTFLIDARTNTVVPLSSTDKPVNILSTFDGALPRVTPGADNYLHAPVRIVPPVAPGGYANPLTDTVTLNYSYHPAYLYIRSATG